MLIIRIFHRDQPLTGWTWGWLRQPVTWWFSERVIVSGRLGHDGYDDNTLETDPLLAMVYFESLKGTVDRPISTRVAWFTNISTS